MPQQPQPKIILPIQGTPPLGVVRSISREEQPPGSLIDASNVMPYGWCDGFMRITQRPAVNEFCDTGTGQPIQGFCALPIIIQPGGVILVPPAYVLSTFTLASTLVTGSTITGPGPASEVITLGSTFTISATLQLNGNPLSTWTGFGSGVANAAPQILFYFYYDGNDLPPSLILGAQFGIGGIEVGPSTTSRSTINVGGITYNNTAGSDGFIGYGTLNFAESSAIEAGPVFNNPQTSALGLALTVPPAIGSYAPNFSVAYAAEISFINATTALFRSYINGNLLGLNILNIPSTSTGFDISQIYVVSYASSTELGNYGTLGVK